MPRINSLMIVGTGGMARLFARTLREKVSTIAVSSRFPEKAKKLSAKLGIKWALMDYAGDFDSILLTTPPQHLPEVAARISEKMAPGSLLMDISSVKVGVVEKIEERIPEYIEYISLHPLFGPTAKKIRGYSIAIIPVRGRAFLNDLIALFESVGLNVIITSAREHDRVMSAIQVAHHMAYLSLALTLWESLDPDSVAKYGTRSLRRTLSTFKMLRGNLKVIREIQELNVYGDQARGKLIECIEKLARNDAEAWAAVEKALEMLPRVSRS